MLKFSQGSIWIIVKRFFKKVNSPYRITVTNSDTMQEAISLDLTKKSLYLLLSTILVSLFLLFSILIFFTPLKLYVPGATNDVSRSKLKELRRITDSLQKKSRQQEIFIENMVAVSKGQLNTALDTQILSEAEIQRALSQNDQKIDKASRYEYLKAQAKRVKDSLKSQNVDKDTSTARSPKQ